MRAVRGSFFEPEEPYEPHPRHVQLLLQRVRQGFRIGIGHLRSRCHLTVVNLRQQRPLANTFPGALYNHPDKILIFFASFFD
jgi:hypothetical protein